MFDLPSACFTLCASGLRISPDLTPMQLENTLHDVIIRHSDTDTGYTHYFVWCDIEPGDFVYADICFSGSTLCSVHLLPQHRTHMPSGRDIPNMNLDAARALVKAWYARFFEEPVLTFPWGRITLIPGSDPIYHPPCVMIRYDSDTKK